MTSQHLADVTKAYYEQMFTLFETMRWSLKAIGSNLDPADVAAIEAKVRELVRKEMTKLDVEIDRTASSLFFQGDHVS